MAQFGEVRVDFVTYTTGVSPSEGSVTTSISGLINAPTFSGNVAVSGIFTANTLVVENTAYFSSGAAGTPSITFTGDSDTGFFTDEANTLSVSTSGIKWWMVSGDGSLYNFSSGALQVPTGTTAARPTVGVTGMIRYNSTLAQYEGYNDGSWALLGGGATGSGGDRVFVLNEQNVTTNYTLPSGNNATSCGPITIDDGVEVIVGDDQNWAIV